MTELNVFLISWRGFLLEGRRSWHAHHRAAVAGFRANRLLSCLPHQEVQLKQACRLLYEVFSRGGLVWGFSFSDRKKVCSWGVLHGKWQPGLLSNYFFSRVRRLHFVQRLSRVFLAPHEGRYGRRRRRLKHRLSKRWSRLAQTGNLPPATYRRRRRYVAANSYSVVIRSLASAATSKVKKRRRRVVTNLHSSRFTKLGRSLLALSHHHYPLAGSYRGSFSRFPALYLSALAFSKAPHESRLRTSWFRRWWRQTYQLKRVTRSAVAKRRFNPTGLSGLRVPQTLSFFALAVTYRQRKKGKRLFTVSPVTLFSPLSWSINLTNLVRQNTLTTFFKKSLTPTKVTGRRVRKDKKQFYPYVKPRYQRWPAPYPSLVAAGGVTLMGATLLNEVTVTGAPFVFFGSTSFVSRRAVFEVLWNQDPFSLKGVSFLLQHLWSNAFQKTLLRMMWSRLCLR